MASQRYRRTIPLPQRRRYRHRLFHNAVHQIPLPIPPGSRRFPGKRGNRGVQQLFAFIHCRDTEYVEFCLHSLLHDNFTFPHISPNLRRSLSDTFYASRFWTERVWYTCLYMCIKETTFFLACCEFKLPFFWDVPPGHCVIDSRLSKGFAKGRDSITHWRSVISQSKGNSVQHDTKIRKLRSGSTINEHRCEATIHRLLKVVCLGGGELYLF